MVVTNAIGPEISWDFSVEEKLQSQLKTMRNALGLLIVLWGLSKFFTTSFTALDDAARESLKLIEVTAVASQQQIKEKI